MAEFCLECWNKLNGANDSERDYIFSEEPELCEGCGKLKPVIIIIKSKNIYNTFI